jgi:hypothetical protein
MGKVAPIRPDALAHWPDPPDEAVYYGLAGEIVRALDPHTEADPVAVLVTFLAEFANVIGRGPFQIMSGTRHSHAFWPVLIGPTSSGRKGTSLSALAPIWQYAAPDWWARREKSLSSGEGLIHLIRDAVRGEEPVKRRGSGGLTHTVTLDPGVTDKRLFVAASEFGGVLEVMKREGNTLSHVLRDAWDGEPLSVNTRHTAARATDTHITILGHVTPEELVELLSEREVRNGFGNRFVWFCVRRSKLLPRGGGPDEGTIVGLGQQLQAAIAGAVRLQRLEFDDAAGTIWDRIYGSLSEGEPGIVGSLLNRATPQVRRVAGIYAALDDKEAIEPPHLKAALALWDFADASVRCVFGASPALDSPLIPTIIAALEGGEMSQSDISLLFHRNVPAMEIQKALEQLVQQGRITRRVERRVNGGRPLTMWSLVR